MTDKGRAVEDILTYGLREIGENPTQEQTELFMKYLSELKKWSRTYNLTALKTDEDIVIKHFLDSCLYLKAFSSKGPLSVADVGSGAGFPGVPIKIMRPGFQVFLIEPGRKKAAFLRHIVRTLGLSEISVIEKRIEALSGLIFDAAVTRALFQAKDFVEKTAGIVKHGGLIILSKGAEYARELTGITNFDVINVRLPATDIVRHLIVIKNEK